MRSILLISFKKKILKKSHQKHYRQLTHMDNNIFHIDRAISEEKFVDSVDYFTSQIYYLRDKITLRNHPLGFYYGIIGKPTKNTSLRLHIWDDSHTKQNASLQIHK